MRKLTAILCLTLAVLLGSAGVSESADFVKGLTAFQRGNYAIALRELTPLAEQGDADAQSHLGEIYYNGQGVIQDDVYAHMWWNIAASSGEKTASIIRDIVAKKMTPADIFTAQKLVRECVRKKYKGC